MYELSPSPTAVQIEFLLPESDCASPELVHIHAAILRDALAERITQVAYDITKTPGERSAARAFLPFFDEQRQDAAVLAGSVLGCVYTACHLRDHTAISIIHLDAQESIGSPYCATALAFYVVRENHHDTNGTVLHGYISVQRRTHAVAEQNEKVMQR